MYVPPAFRETRIPVLHEAMRNCGLATLVTLGRDGLEATHLPMLLDPAAGPFGTLTGHIARANPQWTRPTAGVDALAIFVGPESYITPSWYATKRETGKVVPTWNYLSVHAYGPVTFFDDAERLRAVVTGLTQKHEAGRAEPWAVTDAPAEFIDSQLKGIVGVEIPISRIDGKWKMSQNRPEADRAGVVEGLTRDGGPGRAAVASVMSPPDRDK